MAWISPRKLAFLGFATLGLAAWSQSTNAQKPPQPQQPVVQASATAPEVTRAVAHIHGNVPITYNELADFLIKRGGHKKIDLLINRRIIEIECENRKITVTPQEIEAVLAEDLSGMGINRDQFLSSILPRYGQTYYEWMEDVIRPRIMLKKLCENEVKVTDEDVKNLFENQFGSKRRCQMIMWPADQLKVAQKQFEEARQSQDAFDRTARAQANSTLAAATGHMLPIAKFDAAKDKTLEITAFKLKVGECSGLIECPAQNSYLMLKLHEILPADEKANFEKEKERLYKLALDRKVEAHIPEYFAKLKERAKPTPPYITAPSEWQLKK